MGRVKFAPNLISFSSSLLCSVFYFYIYVSSSVLSYCSVKHDDDDDDDDILFKCTAICDALTASKKSATATSALSGLQTKIPTDEVRYSNFVIS